MSGAGILVVGEYWKRLRGLVLSYIAILLANAGFNPVYYTVLSATEDEQKDAEQQGVTLILPKKIDLELEENPSGKWLILFKDYYPRLSSLSDIRLIIGHYPTTTKAYMEICLDHPEAKKFLVIDCLPRDFILGDELLEEHQVLSKIKTYSEISDSVILVGPSVYYSLSHVIGKSKCLELKWCLFPASDSSLPSLNSRNDQEENQPYKIASVIFGHNANNLESLKLTAQCIDKSSEVCFLVNDRPIIWKIFGVDRNKSNSTKEFFLNQSSSVHLNIEPCSIDTVDGILADIKQQGISLVLLTSQEIHPSQFILWMLLTMSGVSSFVCNHSSAAVLLKNEFSKFVDHFIIEMPIDYKRSFTREQYGEIQNRISRKINYILNQPHTVIKQLKDLRIELNTSCKNLSLWESMNLFYNHCWQNITGNDGADVNSREEDGWTPLHLASLKGHVDIMQLLIYHGADMATSMPTMPQNKEGSALSIDGIPSQTDDSSGAEAPAKQKKSS